MIYSFLFFPNKKYMEPMPIKEKPIIPKKIIRDRASWLVYRNKRIKKAINPAVITGKESWFKAISSFKTRIGEIDKSFSMWGYIKPNWQINAVKQVTTKGYKPGVGNSVGK